MLCRKYYPYFIGMVILIIPFMIRISRLAMAVVHGKNHFMVSMITLSIILFGFTKKIPQAIAITLGIWLLHAYLIQVDFLLPATIYQYICFTFGLILLTQAISNFRVEDNNIILNSLALVAIIESIWVFAEHYYGFVYSDLLNYFGANVVTVMPSTGQPLIEADKMPVGSLTNSNYSGALLAIASISLFRKWWSLGLPLSIGALIIMGATMPVVTLIVGTIVWFLLRVGMRFKYVVTLASIIVMLLGYISFNSKPFDKLGASGRPVIWKQTLHNLFYGQIVVLESGDKKINVKLGGRFITGLGFGYFTKMSKYFVNEKHHVNRNWDQIHNEYLELVYAFGMIGIIYFIVLMVPMFRLSYFDPLLFGTFAAILFNCIGHFTMHISSTAFIAIVVVGLLYNQKKEVLGLKEL